MPSVPDKPALLRQVLERVRQDREALTRSQVDSHEGATHAENRAEHAKDTRATEQSYLARGLADRVEDLRRSEATLEAFTIPEFGDDDRIGVGAWVLIEDAEGGSSQAWWLLPVAGGLKLDTVSPAVHTLTPSAPLARALLGLQLGDEGEFRTPRGERRFEVLAIG